MKTDFKFSNLLGTVYKKGNLIFTPDGNSLLSPVGNRITVFDLLNTQSKTFTYAHKCNIACLALNPQGNLLLSVDEDGRAILSHIHRQIVLYHFSFKSPVHALEFAPNGKIFAACLGRQIEVWHAPSSADGQNEGEIDFAPFVRHRVYTGHYDTVQSIQWSTDSRFFVSGSKDLTGRLWSVNPADGFVPTALAGHRQGVINAWFSADQEAIYTISKDGALFQWSYATRVKDDDQLVATEENARWRITKRHYFFQQSAHVTCAAFHSASDLLITGFSNGVFGIYQLPDFANIHQLSISQQGINCVSINESGNWLAFGTSKLGQLLVWEWQSESYVLKQQAHTDSINSLAYSPDGQKVITCADDGKVKVWDVNSGFCIVTFTEHTSGVTACEFAKRGNVLFTSSLDGSIRAWDLIRYRNFRTFTAPSRLSFSSLTVDPSGEIVCAGSLESFEIHTWSVQTGQLLDRLAGHEGPVVSLSFAPNGGLLVSGSWDKTVRIWNVFARSQTTESLQLQSDVLCVKFRPDSKQVAVSTLDGQLSFWSVAEAMQEGGLDARRDASGGRKLTDRRTAANVAGTKSLSTLAYSVDGSCVLAGGSSKYICLYDVESGVLLKKFTVSINLSLDGTQEFLNSMLLTEGGPRDLIDRQGEESDLEDRLDRRIPGSKRGDAGSRTTKPEVRVTSLSFTPTGRAFSAATTEGLMIYSLDATTQFDPFNLDIDVTPASTIKVLERKDYVRALAMAFRLNDKGLVRRVYEGVPHKDIKFTASELPIVYLARLLRFIAGQSDESPHLEFNLLWIEALLSAHGRVIRENAASYEAELRGVQKMISKVQRELARLADANVYAVDYLLSQPVIKNQNLENGIGLDRIKDLDSMDVDGSVENADGMDTDEEWLGLDESV